MRSLGIPNTKPLPHSKSLAQVVLEICSIVYKNVVLRDLGHAHFQGKLFVRSLGIQDTKLHIKFEVSSSSSFGDMFDRMQKILDVT